MSERFSNMIKIPAEPAARMLALANARLGVKLEAPASALVSEVLQELDRKGAIVDMIRMFAVALPMREKVWWACLAARDLVGSGLAPPLIVEKTEAWVFKPSVEALIAIRRAVEAADPDDETVLAGQAALSADGRLGPEELAQFDAPPGASATYALVMNARSLTMDGGDPEQQGVVLIERAIDIARGGQGDIGPDGVRPKTKGPPGAAAKDAGGGGVGAGAGG